MFIIIDTGVWQSWEGCGDVSIWWLQCLCVCLRSDWVRQELHYDG